MGIIQKQAIVGTVYTYLGVLLGFLTRGIIFPNLLTTEQNGLLPLLVAVSAILAQLANLGINTATTRLFSYFRNNEKKHNGYLFIVGIVVSCGLLLSIAIFYLIKPLLIDIYIEDSTLFIDYINLIIPLTIFTLIFNTLDAYNKVLYNVTFGTFLREFIQRFFIIFFISFYYFQLITFQKFVYLYVISLSLPALLIFIYLLKKRQINIKPQLNFITPHMKKSIISVSLFGILSGFTGTVILLIDGIMVSSMLDLSANGIYTITFFFGTLVLVPSRALLKISSAVIADAWKAENKQLIQTIYYKSCLNQLIIGGLVFIGIWANIHNVFEILPKEYEAGRYVIFFIALANLIDMGTGVNGVIISTSKYYRIETYLILFLLVLTVVTNLIFIPAYGLIGAAIASFLSKLIYNAVRYLFLLRKYRLQPFDYNALLTIFIAGGVYFLNLLLPVFENFIIDIIVRSSLITVIFGSLILVFKVSDDVNLKVQQIWQTVRNKIK